MPAPALLYGSWTTAACDVAAGAIVTRQMICPPAQSELFRLHDEMDNWLYSESKVNFRVVPAIKPKDRKGDTARLIRDFASLSRPIRFAVSLSIRAML